MTLDNQALSGLSEAELAAEVARIKHKPDREELRALLIRYFVGPITDQHVDRLFERLEQRSSFGERLPLHEQIERLYLRGWAWREEVFANHRTPARVDLLLLLAHQMWEGNDYRKRHGDTLEFTQPKLYCPSNVVGTWEQLEPVHRSLAPLLWHFDADGVLRTTSPDAPENYRLWCVYRNYGWNQHEFEIIFHHHSSGLWGISAIEQTADEMAGVYLCHMAHTPFRFRRVS